MSRKSAVIHQAYDKVLARAATLFDQARDRNFVRIDRWFAGLLFFEWAAAILLSVLVSPFLWSGGGNLRHLGSAILFGAAIIVVPNFLALKCPGKAVTRHAIAIGQMLMSGLLIELTAGRPETHFHVFGSLAILAFYRDWRVLVTASVVICFDHFLRGIYWPQSVYGVPHVSQWRTMEHAGWIAFEDLFLIRSIIASTQELWDTCQRQSELEASNLIIEARVEERTRELKVTEERFRMLSSASPIGIILTDSSGSCMYVNRRWEAISGMAHDECLGYDWLKALHFDDRQAVLAYWTHAAEKAHELIRDFRILRPDGSTVWVHARATSLGMQEGSPRGYVWTIEDITERKNAESRLTMQYAITNALAESSDLSDAAPKLLQAICENRGWQLGVLWMWDEEDELLRFQGMWAQAGVTGKDFEETSRRLTFSQSDGPVGDAFQSVRPYISDHIKNVELFGRAKLFGFESGGGYVAFPIVESGQALGVLEFLSREPIGADSEFHLMLNSIGSQIGQFAERMSAEMRLKDFDARIRAMLESAVDGIITFDRAGIIDSVNPAFERILGLDADAILGREVFQVIPSVVPSGLSKHEKIATMQDVRDDLKSMGYSERELIIRRKDDLLIPVELRVSQVILGTRNFYSGILRDITERKEVERRVSEFYSTVSHELRTPLTSIRGALGLMEGGVVGEIPSQALELATIARTSCDRLIRLINDILDLRKIEAGKLDLKLEPLDAEFVVKATADSLRGMAEEYGVSLYYQVSEVNTIFGDYDRVVQILTNLASNAIKFSGRGGQVNINAWAADGGMVRFEVIDNGPGIPPGQMHKLFGKFQQLDSSDTRAQGGTGLGLAISKALVEKHNGRIGVESEWSKGSTFWFEIPEYKSKQYAAPHKERRPESVQSGTE
ncbi:MAG TPA: PAS domain S-box protein [Candidatus Obscuribacterales bacterium]